MVSTLKPANVQVLAATPFLLTSGTLSAQSSKGNVPRKDFIDCGGTIRSATACLLLVWVVLFAVAVCAGCSQTPFDPEAGVDPEILKQLRSTYNQEEVELLFGGAQGLDVLSTATRVRAYRVAELDESQDNGPEKIFHYSVTSELLEVDLATSKELAALLSDRVTYRELHLPCLFEPAVGFRFESGSGRIDVLVCFGCEEVYVSPSGKFADIRSNNLLTIAKRMFPEDKIIQGIHPQPELSQSREAKTVPGAAKDD
jgi:hypothetical protein